MMLFRTRNRDDYDTAQDKAEKKKIMILLKTKQKRRRL